MIEKRRKSIYIIGQRSNRMENTFYVDNEDIFFRVQTHFGALGTECLCLKLKFDSTKTSVFERPFENFHLSRCTWDGVVKREKF